MRDLFRGYYQPTAAEVDAIWANGITVLDANVLLSLYKVLPATSKLYLDALDKRSDNNWLPYQVAHEFHRNVHKIRSEQTAGHAKRIDDVKKFRNVLRNTESKSRLQTSKIQTKIDGLLDSFINQLVAEQSSIKDQTHHHKPDDLLERISNLFEGKVGPAPTAESLDLMYVTGKERFEREVPPGYEDKKTKSGGDEYGDYIFWQQVIDHAKAEKLDVVLVTDDNKADWWLKIDGDSVAPRPELIQEFRDSTGQNIVIWPSGKFYSHLMTETEISGRSAEVEAAASDMQNTVSLSQKDKDPIAKNEWLRNINFNQTAAISREHVNQNPKQTELWLNPEEFEKHYLEMNERMQQLIGGKSEPIPRGADPVDVLLDELDRLTNFSLTLHRQSRMMQESMRITPADSDLRHKQMKELHGVLEGISETDLLIKRLRQRISHER